MSTIVPEGEALRNAVRWISAERAHRPEASLASLLDEAALRFDLTPLDQQFLLNTFLTQKKD